MQSWPFLGLGDLSDILDLIHVIDEDIAVECTLSWKGILSAR